MIRMPPQFAYLSLTMGAVGLTIRNTGWNKVMLLTLFREVFDIGLQESKNIVEGLTQKRKIILRVYPEVYQEMIQRYKLRTDLFTNTHNKMYSFRFGKELGAWTKISDMGR